MCGWAARRCLEATLRVSRALVRTFLPFGAGQLTQSGCAWSIRHIYREFNQVADKLAGDCLSNAANARASPSW